MREVTLIQGGVASDHGSNFYDLFMGLWLAAKLIVLVASISRTQVDNNNCKQVPCA